MIEDSGDLQALLSFALNGEGYSVDYAFNGKEGYEKILATHPDLVMLDLMLPGMNGLEILEKLSVNQNMQTLPIIVMTAHGDAKDKIERKVKSFGAREYVRKPFNIKDVIGLVGRTLSRQAAATTSSKNISKGGVRLELGYKTLWIEDRLVATLSPYKVKLLELLLGAKGPVHREKLILGIWGKTGNPAVLEKLVQRLREDLGEESRRLQTSEEGYELIG